MTDPQPASVSELLAAARRLLEDAPGRPAVAARIRDLVVPALTAAAGDPADLAPVARVTTMSVADGLADLAIGLAQQARRTGDAELRLAAAAAQDVAGAAVTGSDRDALVATLAGAGPIEAPRIEVAVGGPHVLQTNGTVTLLDHLGNRLPTTPLMTLCRCGRSSVKPACDGVCRRDGFDDAKDPDRVTDRRDNYVGVQVEVLDNRGLCQHSALCTERVSTVFRLDEEPFVTPSGGRMDEIIRAVRDCPSGALSYAIDGIEARSQVDYGGQRAATVTVTKDGPYRITGGIDLVEGTGGEVTRNLGASTEHCALCRCGQSQNKPFCSGRHWSIGFTDPVADPDHIPSVFEWAGGLPAFLRLTRLFYEKHIAGDPVLAPVFANMSADHPERVAKWLAEVFGGPSYYSDEYGGYPRMLAEHIGKHLTEEQRSRWVQLLLASATDAGLPNDAEFRAAFGSYIEWGSRLAVENSQTHSRPAPNMPMPSWDWSTAAGPPTGRVSALAPVAAEPDEVVVAPAADEVVRFDKHIKPLFRRRDRQSMLFAFDLWALGDVKTHAEAVLARLQNGTMPCDGAWPGEQVETFRRWIDTGMTG